MAVDARRIAARSPSYLPTAKNVPCRRFFESGVLRHVGDECFALHLADAPTAPDGITVELSPTVVGAVMIRLRRRPAFDALATTVGAGLELVGTRVSTTRASCTSGTTWSSSPARASPTSSPDPARRCASVAGCVSAKVARSPR